MCTWIPFSSKSWSITTRQWSSLWHHPWRQCNCEIRWSYLTWIWARQSLLTKVLAFRMAPRTLWDPRYWTTLWARCFWTGHLSLLMYLLAHFNTQVWFRMWLAHSLWRCSVCKYHIITVTRLHFYVLLVLDPDATTSCPCGSQLTDSSPLFDDWIVCRKRCVYTGMLLKLIDRDIM